MARLLDIAYRDASRAPMQHHEACAVSREAGVHGDFRGKPGKRQVTVVSRDAWEAACEQLGIEVPWTARRANLLVDSLAFGAESVGKIIRIGSVRLRITRETDPCPRMDEAQPGLMRALSVNWRAGVCCEVLESGDISLGDDVSMD